MRVALLLGCVLALIGCSSQPDPDRLEPVPQIALIDRRPLVTTVTSTRRDRLPGGVIVTATGLPPSQGWWAAELVPLDEETDSRTLAFEFKVVQPRQAQPAGAPRSREVVVGLFLSDQRIEGIRQITIIGATNRRSLRP